jgi:hypothetical protein
MRRLYRETYRVYFPGTCAARRLTKINPAPFFLEDAHLAEELAALLEKVMRGR